MKFLTSTNYPHLCKHCKTVIDELVSIFAMDLMGDTDDCEAPLMYAGDHKMLCGGHECIKKFERKQTAC